MRLGWVIQDVRYAVRTLTRNPGFSVVALLALAVGIGANTAVFSVVNAVLLQPLPFAEPDRLVMVFNYRLRGGASLADLLDWRARSQSFESLDAFESNPFTNNRFTWTGDGEPEKVVGYRVTAGFFRTLGVQPIIGRTFIAGVTGSDPVTFAGAVAVMSAVAAAACYVPALRASRIDPLVALRNE
jgi:putative ABC transport system permease protein